MSKERFDHLLSLIREDITKKDTPMRKAISIEERLVTFRYCHIGRSVLVFVSDAQLSVVFLQMYVKKYVEFFNRSTGKPRAQKMNGDILQVVSTI